MKENKEMSIDEQVEVFAEIIANAILDELQIAEQLCDKNEPFKNLLL